MSSVVEPRVPRAGRHLLDPAAAAALPRRQLVWAGAQAPVLALLLGIPATAAWPDLAWGLALGLGVATALAPQPGRAALAALAVFAATALAGIFGDGSSSLSLLAQPTAAAGFSMRGLAGSQVLAGGAAAGIALGRLDRGPRDLLRTAQLALAGAATAGLGWWAADALVPDTWAGWLSGIAGPVLTALVASQLLVVAAVRFRSAARMPHPRALRKALRERYHPPCERAWRLDQELAKACPDPETRDGLGEVAAWVYRLQWTLQRLDGDLAPIEEHALRERIVELTDQAASTDDAFTRDRKLATAERLDQLLEHRAALAGERHRTAALVEYAAAFLEEARAGLALARAQPGAHTPAGLDDVLDRLREHGADGEARRRSARELARIA